MSKLKEEQEDNRRNSIVITKEMKKEFWKHGLNSHTGHPPAKEFSNSRVLGDIYSLSDFGARISSTDGYGNK